METRGGLNSGGQMNHVSLQYEKHIRAASFSQPGSTSLLHNQNFNPSHYPPTLIVKALKDRYSGDEVESDEKKSMSKRYNDEVRGSV